MIPAAQTATPVQLDQVLSALDYAVRDSLQMTLGELADAMDAGLAKEFNRSLPDQAPAFKFSAIVAEALLGRRPHDLSGVVRDFGTTAAALDRSPPRLKSLLENFHVFARSLAVEDANLAATVTSCRARWRPPARRWTASTPRSRACAGSRSPRCRACARRSRPSPRCGPLVAQLDGLVGQRRAARAQPRPAAARRRASCG